MVDLDAADADFPVTNCAQVYSSSKASAAHGGDYIRVVAVPNWPRRLHLVAGGDALLVECRKDPQAEWWGDERELFYVELGWSDSLLPSPSVGDPVWKGDAAAAGDEVVEVVSPADVNAAKTWPKSGKAKAPCIVYEGARALRFEKGERKEGK